MVRGFQPTAWSLRPAHHLYLLMYPSRPTMSLTVLCIPHPAMRQLSRCYRTCVWLVLLLSSDNLSHSLRRSSVIPVKPLNSGETLHHQAKPCIATNISGEINFAIAADIHCKCHSKPSWIPGNVLGKQNRRTVDLDGKFGKDWVNRHCENGDDYEIVTKETSW